MSIKPVGRNPDGTPILLAASGPEGKNEAGVTSEQMQYSLRGTELFFNSKSEGKGTVYLTTKCA